MQETIPPPFPSSEETGKGGVAMSFYLFATVSAFTSIAPSTRSRESRTTANCGRLASLIGFLGCDLMVSGLTGVPLS